MDDELQKSENQDVMPISAFSQSFQATMAVAKSMLKSGMLPKAYSNSEQVVMAVLRARELNIPVMMALMRGLYPVNNQFGMYGTLQLALVRRSGKMTKFTISSEEEIDKNKSCTCTMEREGKEIQSSTFSLRDATTAGLVKDGGGWTKYLKNMLRWRSITNTINLLFSDVTGGMNTPEELDPTMIVDAEVVTDDIHTIKDPMETFNQAKSALEKAIKTYKIEDLESWKELYADDMKSLEPRLSGVLTREYEAAYNKLKPKVIDVVNSPSAENSKTENSKSIS